MTLAPVTDDPVEEAREAGLRYVDDSQPGYRRVRKGTGFRYLDDQGRPITHEATLERIRGLVIPPAWDEVWICPSPRGHLQATGRDDKGRKQYRYHERYRQHRDEAKYHRLAAFGRALPAIRRRVEKDLRARCLTRDKVLAIVVHLLQTTHIRIGNDAYAREHGHYGLTTLRRRHVEISRREITFHFTGKSGKEREIRVHDPRLARALARCYDLPGYELFKYVDEAGRRCRVDAAEVNDYLREATGEAFTAKDFRTWAGTVITAIVLTQFEPFTDEKEREKNIVAAVKTTASELGNTPATCRKYYIHPLVLEAYRDGSLAPLLGAAMESIGQAKRHRMTPEEAAVLALLEGAAEPGGRAP